MTHIFIGSPEQACNVDLSWKEQLTFQLPEKLCKSASLRLLVCAKHVKGGSENVLGQVGS